jgi:cation:H+ antiporter
VFALSHGSLAHPLPMGNGQMSELLLTAAQSLLAVVLLASLRLSIGGAILLFGLFVGQFILPVFSPIFPGLAFGLGAHQIHPVFSMVYLAVAAALFLQQPGLVFNLIRGWSRGGSTGRRLAPARDGYYCSSADGPYMPGTGTSSSRR